MGRQLDNHLIRAHLEEEEGRMKKEEGRKKKGENVFAVLNVRTNAYIRLTHTPVSCLLSSLSIHIHIHTQYSTLYSTLQSG
jgi:hypothetical protein